jgi:putative ABC transport system permease protein
MLARVIAYVRGIAYRRRINAEVDDELRFHLEQEIEAHVARGVPPAEARRLALRDFGGPAQTREAVFDVRTIWLDLVWRDVRDAVRALRAAPAFTAVALTVLTLSIGATTAIFSVVDAVILRRMPFPDSDRLVAVGERNVKGQSRAALNLTTPQTFLDWRDQQDVFTGVAAVAYAEISLKREGDALPENLRAQRVTADIFSVLQTTPLIGRGFSRDHEAPGSGGVAVISHRLWQRRFGGAPDVIGQHLDTPLASLEIVGVMPPDFTYPVDTYVLEGKEPIDVWVPYVFEAHDRVRGNSYGYNLHVVGRLRPGVTLEHAQARMDQIMAGLAAETPRWFEDSAAKVEPLQEFLTRDVRTWMVMLLGAVLFVLLIACVNLANLMLARATTRTRELELRAAIGASRWDLARVLLLESLVLSVAGAALGVVLAWWTVDILRAAMPVGVPRAATIAVDLRVLTATAVAAIFTGIAFGLAPVLQFSRPRAGALHLRERSGTAGTRTNALRATLVVAEVALAVVLLVGSGLFLASFARLMSVDLGLDHREVVTTQVRVLEIPQDVQRAAARNRQLLLNVLQRVRTIPGVQVAALAGGGLPLRGDLRTALLFIPGRELPRNTDIALNEISPEYFKTIKVPLLKGRMFSDADTETSEAAVILNQAAAARYFGGDDALGKVIRVQGTRTVVGIVGNMRIAGPEREWRTQAFIPVTQGRVYGATLIVRTGADAQGLRAAIRQAIWSEFPATLPLRIDEHAMEYFFDGLVAERRFNMLLLGLFGVLGLVIAGVGVYGVIAYLVAQRTHEFGIRMALGAARGRIVMSVVSAVLVYLVVGLAIGLTSAWGFSEFIREFLFEVQPRDPAVYGSVVAVLTIAGLAAAFVPARRAAGVDPAIALRCE